MVQWRKPPARGRSCHDRWRRARPHPQGTQPHAGRPGEQAVRHPSSRLALGERRNIAEHRHVQAHRRHLRRTHRRSARTAGYALLPKLRHALLPTEGPGHRGRRHAVRGLLLLVLPRRRVHRGRVARRAYRALRPLHGGNVRHLARRGRLLHGSPPSRPRALETTPPPLCRARNPQTLATRPRAAEALRPMRAPRRRAGRSEPAGSWPGS